MKQYIKNIIYQKLVSLRATEGDSYTLKVPDKIVDELYGELLNGRAGWYRLNFKHQSFDIKNQVHTTPMDLWFLYLENDRALHNCYIYFDIADLRDHMIDKVLELKCHTLTN